MNASMISWSIATFLLAAGAATAYHIAPPADGNNPTDPATTWTGSSLLFSTCESTGISDPVNPQPGPMGGLGVLCYANSQSIVTVADAEDKQFDHAVAHAGGDPIWSAIQPTCLDGPCGDWSLTPDWFARIGNNAHSCNGFWDKAFVYKEEFAYYYGRQPLDGIGASGHVAIFLNDPFVSGSYSAWVDIDEDAILDVAETALNCSPSPFIGISDALKPPAQGP